MTFDNILPLLLSSLIFAVVAICFKCMPNEYPEFHKSNPYNSYYGLKIHFHGMEFNKKNWAYLKMTGFKTSFAAGGIYLFISALYLTLNSFLFHEPIAKSFFSNSAVVLGVLALLYLIAKFCKFNDNN